MAHIWHQRTILDISFPFPLWWRHVSCSLLCTPDSPVKGSWGLSCCFFLFCCQSIGMTDSTTTFVSCEVWGFELSSSCLCGKHFTYWAYTQRGDASIILREAALLLRCLNIKGDGGRSFRSSRYPQLASKFMATVGFWKHPLRKESLRRTSRQGRKMEQRLKESPTYESI